MTMKKFTQMELYSRHKGGDSISGLAREYGISRRIVDYTVHVRVPKFLKEISELGEKA